MHLFPCSYILYHTCTTQLRIEPRCSGLKADYGNHYTAQLAAMQWQNVIFKPNVWEKGNCSCVSVCLTSFYWYEHEELVVKNLPREPHSSITVHRFRKLKSSCHVIAILSGWHPCPNLNCNASFEAKKGYLCAFPSSSCITPLLSISESNPGAEGW